MESKVNHDEIGVTQQRMPKPKTSTGVLIRYNNFGPKRQKAARLFSLFDQTKRKAGRFGRDELIDKPAINNQAGKEWIDIAHGSSHS
jgi:hypothetical protein